MLSCAALPCPALPCAVLLIGVPARVVGHVNVLGCLLPLSNLLALGWHAARQTACSKCSCHLL